MACSFKGVVRLGIRKNEIINTKRNNVAAKMNQVRSSKTGLRKLKASRLMMMNKTAAMEIL